MATLLVHATLASTLSRLIGRLQTATVVLNLALIVAIVVVLLLGTRSCRGGNDARVVFAEVRNLTGWSPVLAFLSPIWTAAGCDSCVGVSEEASNAARAVPLAIMLSVGLSGPLGFVVVATIAACITDVEAVLATPFGQPVRRLSLPLLDAYIYYQSALKGEAKPIKKQTKKKTKKKKQMAQVYYDALGKQGTLAFMAFLLAAQFFMGLAVLVVASRQAWAFSRDGALPS
ncbi:hypothetical protein RB593_000938 [Gaeumannomyces tritici]